MEIWELNNIIQDKAVDNLTGGLEEFQQIIFETLRNYILNFTIIDGKFDINQVPDDLLNGIRNELQDLVFDMNFDDEVTSFLDNFDEIESNIVKLHQQQNSIDVAKSVLSSQKEFAIESTVYSMKEANMSLRFVDPIKKALYKRVAFGSGVVETESMLRDLILGTDKGGILERWVGQVARDSINQYEGTLNQEIKSKYDLKAVRYVGSIVKDSRSQCVRWASKGRILDTELENEIRWAYRNGSGMIADTAVSNFCVNRGGYNCRHTSFPVR